MTTGINGQLAGSGPRTATMYVKPVLAALFVVVAVLSAVVTGPPARAADVRPLINERTCNAEQLPRQIWLTSRTRPTRCFGGTVGSMSLNNFPVQWLSPGDYHGTIYCVGLTLRFRPAEDSLLDRTCSRLEIRPAS